MNKIYISIDIDEVFFYITFLDHFFGLLPYYPLFHSHLKVLRINDKDYSITFATYFNVEWYEHRLKVAKELEVSVTNVGRNLYFLRTTYYVFLLFSSFLLVSFV